LHARFGTHLGVWCGRSQRTHCSLQSRYDLLTQPLASLFNCSGPQWRRHALEEVGAHLPVPAVSLQASDALVGGILTRVKVLAVSFAGSCQRESPVVWRRCGQAHLSNLVAVGPAQSLLGSLESLSDMAKVGDSDGMRQRADICQAR
jgi:hypothetical protein